MKPSHITTPRTMAECSFDAGRYVYSPVSDRPTLLQFLAYGTIGLAMFGGLLACMLSYFDVPAK